MSVDNELVPPILITESPFTKMSVSISVMLYKFHRVWSKSRQSVRPFFPCLPLSFRYIIKRNSDYGNEMILSLQIMADQFQFCSLYGTPVIVFRNTILARGKNAIAFHYSSNMQSEISEFPCSNSDLFLCVCQIVYFSI